MIALVSPCGHRRGQRCVGGRQDANFSSWVHGTLGCDYFFLWMPLYGPNQQHNYPPHHSFFAGWQAQGDKTLRYFVEPVALTVNYALSLGYEEVYLSGLSGGGWTTTVYAAIDPRVVVSLPVAGSLPWYLFSDHQVGDYEQRPQPGVADWYLTQAKCALHSLQSPRLAFARPPSPASTELAMCASRRSFTELYVLAGLEPGRVSLQVLHENDPCCFHGATRHAQILGYDSRVGAVLRSRGGGSFSTAISDWNVHEWDEHSRAIVAAALAEAKARPRAPNLARLPCDILHHAASSVPCPWPPAPPAPPVEGAARA